MTCPHCAKDIQPGAKFCMFCGKPMVAERTLDALSYPQAPRTAEAVGPQTGAVARPARPAVKKSGLTGAQKMTAAAIGVALLALLGLVAWKAGLFQARGSNPNTGVLEAKGSNPKTGVLQAAGSNPKTGILQAEGSKNGKPATMPADIEDWLKHLERCEKQRQGLIADEKASFKVTATKLSVGGGVDALNKIMEGGDPKPPGDELASQTTAMRADWNRLIQFFGSKPPPPRCRKLAMTYDNVLVQTSLSMLVIGDILGGAAKDPQGAVSKLQGMEGDTYQNIDVPVASSDNQVKEICRDYNKDKWFVIKGDVAGPLAGTGGGNGF
jgi:hypothetical protein